MCHPFCSKDRAASDLREGRNVWGVPSPPDAAVADEGEIEEPSRKLCRFATGSFVARISVASLP
jgi:hypothetical protein